MQNQVEFSPDEIKKMEISTALNTLAYAISSDDTYLINKNVNKIISKKISELNARKKELKSEKEKINSNDKKAKKEFDKKESQFNDDMTNLSAVMAFVKENPNIGEMQLVATSGMFKRGNGNREFNSGVNTFAFYDETNKNMVIAERGTASGEWGDNQYMVTNAITGQDYQAVQVRERFNEEFQKKGFEIKNIIETGHSKGGHKALICHIFNITQEINKINESSETKVNKIKAVNNLIKKYHCICEDSPWLSNETIEFFKKQLEPAYQNGLIPRPDIFLNQILAKNITRVNCENDYVSAINEQNKFGKEYIIKQTHNTVTGAHAIRTLCNVDENFNFNGKLPEQTNEYGKVHIAAQKLFTNINNSSLEKKHRALKFFMSTADNVINKTNQDVTGTKYYVASKLSDQKGVNKAKIKDGLIFLGIALKTFFTKAVLAIMPKMVKKSKKVNAEQNFEKSSDKHTSNLEKNSLLEKAQDIKNQVIQNQKQLQNNTQNKQHKTMKNKIEVII